MLLFNQWLTMVAIKDALQRLFALLKVPAHTDEDGIGALQLGDALDLLRRQVVTDVLFFAQCRGKREILPPSCPERCG